MCSIWNMCLQRWADHRFWTLSHSGAAPEASGLFSVVFICEEDRQCERFSGPGSHARALCNCQPALPSAHIKVVFPHVSGSGFCGHSRAGVSRLDHKRLRSASKIRLTARSCDTSACSSRENTNTFRCQCGAEAGPAPQR